MNARLRVSLWAGVRSAAGQVAYWVEPPRWDPPEPEHRVYATRLGRAAQRVCQWADTRHHAAAHADFPRRHAAFTRWLAKRP